MTIGATITIVEEELSFHQFFSILSSNDDCEGELLVSEHPVHVSLKYDVKTDNILDVLKDESMCERVANALTDSDMIP